MSRCEIAAMWFNTARRKTKEDVGEGRHLEQTGSIELSELSPAKKTIQPVLIRSWSFITTNSGDCLMNPQ